MGTRDPRVDAYIEAAPAYARPILTKLRRLFHKGGPALEESLKWGAPSFGHQGIVAGMAAFQQHVSFGFWKARAMRDPEKLFGGGARQSPFAIKVKSVKELPPDRVIVAYVKEAVALNGTGVKAPPGCRERKRPAARVPADLARALARNRRARATFDGFPPGRRREYIEWITEAKRPETRAKRLATTLAWLAEGKPRNWKYMKR